MTLSQPVRIVSSRHVSIAITLVLAAATLALSACTKQNFLNENDRLRRENLELERQVQQLLEDLDRRIRESQALKEQLAAKYPDHTDAMELPRVSEIRLARYSGVIDTDNDGTDDQIRLYLRTLDQFGRFLPAAGRLTVQAVAITPDMPPTLVAIKEFDVDQLNSAYRSNWTGTHFTLKVPLPQSLPDDKLTVKATFQDTATGSTFSTEKSIALKIKRK